MLAAFAALEGTPGFVGNVEGRDIPRGTVDVVVTDGFTGNVALKLAEGVAEMVVSEIRAGLTSSVRGKVAGALARPSLRGLARRIDPEEYGGAYLLGVRGLSVIGHGNAERPGHRQRAADGRPGGPRRPGRPARGRARGARAGRIAPAPGVSWGIRDHC